MNEKGTMIRKPPQHNTTSPPGQVVNPVGVVSPTKQIKDLASEISDFHAKFPVKQEKEEK